MFKWWPPLPLPIIWIPLRGKFDVVLVDPAGHRTGLISDILLSPS